MGDILDSLSVYIPSDFKSIKQIALNNGYNRKIINSKRKQDKLAIDIAYPTKTKTTKSVISHNVNKTSEAMSNSLNRHFNYKIALRTSNSLGKNRPKTMNRKYINLMIVIVR